MECIAKILREEKGENKNFWKYGFLDLQTGQEGWFHANQKLNYFSSLPGKVEISLESAFQSLLKKILYRWVKISRTISSIMAFSFPMPKFTRD